MMRAFYGNITAPVPDKRSHASYEMKKGRLELKKSAQYFVVDPTAVKKMLLTGLTTVLFSLVVDKMAIRTNQREMLTKNIIESIET